jgi:hypothetical protein
MGNTPAMVFRHYRERQYREFLEILDDRHGQGSTLMTSQFPVSAWHEAIPDPTVADALLDRLIHNAYRIELKGDSLRKRRSREPAANSFLPPSREASKGTKKEGENGRVVPLTRDSDNVKKGQKA